MKVLFILILNVSRIWAQDKTVYIQSPLVSDIPYHAQLKGDPQGISFAHVFLELRRTANAGSQLQSDFMQAQENYLTNENRSNIKYWRDVTRWAHKADWSVTQREMIQIAYLRWAQLTRDPKEEIKLVENAYALDPGLKIEGLQLSPSVIAQWMEFKKATATVPLENDRFAGFSHVLINGSPYILGSSTILQIPNGVHRFTWVSNQYLPVTRVIESKNINKMQLPRTPLTDGTCEKPDISSGLQELINEYPDLKTAKLLIVYPEECVVALNTTTSTSKNIEHSPFDDAISKLTTQNGHAAKLSVENKPFYKRPKFWLGSVLVSGVLLYFHQQNDHPADAPPTHREGF